MKGERLGERKKEKLKKTKRVLGLQKNKTVQGQNGRVI